MTLRAACAVFDARAMLAHVWSVQMFLLVEYANLLPGAKNME